MPVEVHRRSVQPLDRPADEVADSLRRGDAERVHDDHLARARLDGGLVGVTVEVEVGAGRVDTEERGVDVVVGGETHRLRDALEHDGPRDSDGIELRVRDRGLDHRVADAQLDERLEIGGDRA